MNDSAQPVRWRENDVYWRRNWPTTERRSEVVQHVRSEDEYRSWKVGAGRYRHDRNFPVHLRKGCRCFIAIEIGTFCSLITRWRWLSRLNLVRVVLKYLEAQQQFALWWTQSRKLCQYCCKYLCNAWLSPCGGYCHSSRQGEIRQTHVNKNCIVDARYFFNVSFLIY